MKKQENNFDEIDKILFKAFENSPDVPDSTKHTIHNAFKLPRKQKKKNYVYSTLQKVAIFILQLQMDTFRMLIWILFLIIILESKQII